MQRLQELQILKLYSLNITYKHSKIKQKRAKYHFMNKAASIKTVKNKNGHRVPVFCFKKRKATVFRGFSLLKLSSVRNCLSVLESNLFTLNAWANAGLTNVFKGNVSCMSFLASLFLCSHGFSVNAT